MKRELSYAVLGCVLALSLPGCGNSTTSSTTTTATATTAEATTNAAAAVTAAFGSSSSSSSLKTPGLLRIVQLFIKEAKAEDESDGTTCNTIDTDDSPDDVTSSGTGVYAQGTTQSATHGPSGDSQTTDLDTSFCIDSAGTSNDNSSGELFASFTLSEATLTCGTDVFTMSGTGIWRNQPDSSVYPDIYGAFVFTGSGGDPETVNCHIQLDGNENILASTCDSDEAQDALASCSIDASS